MTSLSPDEDALCVEQAIKSDVDLDNHTHQSLTPQTWTATHFSSKLLAKTEPCMKYRLNRDHLGQIDSQGRCIITDHDSFVLLNVYGPAVTSIDNERFAMKMTLYQVCSLCLHWPCAATG